MKRRNGCLTVAALFLWVFLSACGMLARNSGAYVDCEYALIADKEEEASCC